MTLESEQKNNQNPAESLLQNVGNDQRKFFALFFFNPFDEPGKTLKGKFQERCLQIMTAIKMSASTVQDATKKMAALEKIKDEEDREEERERIKKSLARSEGYFHSAKASLLLFCDLVLSLPTIPSADEEKFLQMCQEFLAQGQHHYRIRLEAGLDTLQNIKNDNQFLEFVKTFRSAVNNLEYQEETIEKIDDLSKSLNER